ncbi:unnamed protein product [Tuber aestivum]|uniref:Uncharacterized protein n=1 Tax=Tuber aestivum TaxID=59557 RepID=A0A292PM72_9PEZI|nr:unnamed protein product [Tuber aestivum]
MYMGCVLVLEICSMSGLQSAFYSSFPYGMYRSPFLDQGVPYSYFLSPLQGIARTAWPKIDSDGSFSLSFFPPHASASLVSWWGIGRELDTAYGGAENLSWIPVLVQ